MASFEEHLSVVLSSGRFLYLCVLSAAPQQSEICVKFSVFHTIFWREILVKFSVTHPNPGERSMENFTKISRQISRHLWQRKTEKIFTSALLQCGCSGCVHQSLSLLVCQFLSSLSVSLSLSLCLCLCPSLSLSLSFSVSVSLSESRIHCNEIHHGQRSLGCPTNGWIEWAMIEELAWLFIAHQTIWQW